MLYLKINVLSNLLIKFFQVQFLNAARKKK